MRLLSCVDIHIPTMPTWRRTSFADDEESLLAHVPEDETKQFGVEGEGEVVKVEEVDEDLTLDVPWISLFALMDSSHLGILFVALALSVITAFIIPGVSILLGSIFDSFARYGTEEYSGEKLVEEVGLAVQKLAGLGFGSWFLSGLFLASWVVFGEVQAKRAREVVFEGFLGRELEWFDKKKNGVAAIASASQT